jgi:hypothetical protein
VPAGAVLVEKVGASVFTVADGKARKTAVKAGFQNAAFVEIVDGLAPDSPVLIFGKTAPADGQDVRLAEAK